MSDRISQLRSRLRFTCDEFKNLVNDDLAELKWKTFHMIMLGTFQAYPTLAEEAEALQRLFDRRLKEMGLERSAGLTRAERNQSEHEYRLRAGQCMIDGLSKLKWPQAMVAFSNPLMDLMEDNVTKLSAIEFMVNVLNPHAQRGWDPSDHGNRGNSSTSYSPSKALGASSPGDDRKVSSARSTAGAGQAGERRGGESSSTRPHSGHAADSSRGGSSVYGVGRAAPLSQSPGSIRSGVETRRSNHIAEESFTSDKETPRVSKHESTPITDVACLQEALKSAISARDEIEDQIERTLHDLNIAVAELAGTSQGGEKSGADGSKGSSTKREPKNLGEAVLSGDTGTLAAMPLWRTVRSRVDSLYKQWLEARKCCRDALVAQIEIHPSSSKLFSLGSSTSYNRQNTTENSSISRATGRVGSAESNKRKPFLTAFAEGEEENGESSTFLDLSAISAGGSDAYLQARISTARSVSSVGSRFSTTSSRFGTNNKGNSSNANMALRLATPSTIRVYHMLGLRRPKSVIKIEDAMGTGGTEENGSFELDRHRIFQLQRDLVDFARAAFQVCCEDPIASMQMPQGHDPSASPAAVSMSHLTDLHRASRRLLIDVSALAPLAPVDARFPMSSGISGLDSLVAEMADVLSKTKNGNKLMQNESITRAIDRATTEQAALVQCLYFAEQHAKSAQAKERQQAVRVKSFNARAIGVVEKCDADIQEALKLVHNVVLETNNAEKCRIELPSGNSAHTNGRINRGSSTSSAAAVCPLDALCRGYMGAEVAALVNSIRTFANNFESIESCLTTVRRHIRKDIIKELETMLTKTLLIPS